MRRYSVIFYPVFIMVILALLAANASLSIADIHIYSGQSIQSAINVAKDGYVIIVHPGTYYESISFSGKAITLRGTSPADSGTVAATIIDGNQAGRVVTFDHGEGPGSVLSGVTLRNGNVSSSPGGGGIYCERSCPSITHCIITGNSADYGYGSGGGGIHCNQASPSISHCTITNNYAWDGGGIYCTGFSFPVITHCSIYGNLTDYTGGAIFCYKSSPCISNCTVSDNYTEGIGGAIFCTGSSSPYIVNSIFWGNGSEISFEYYCNPRLSYCDIQGGYAGVGNIDAAPRFVDPASGDYRLGSGSPCIDAGHPRMLDDNGSRSDMGAQGGEKGWQANNIIITVAADGTGDYKSIQDAIDYAVPGDKIMVAAGTYTENLVIGGKNLLLVGQVGIKSTIIDGSASGPVILLVNTETGTVLEGLTFRNGLSEDSGGGIGCCRSAAEITNCTITGNWAKYGGGIFFKNSDSAKINNCIINNNLADGGAGGGIYCDQSSPDISQCKIEGNSTNSGIGGGIDCFDSSPLIIDCIVTENSAEMGGGIYCEFDTSPNIINCTISGNSAYVGSGIYCEYESSSAIKKPEIINSILRDNTTGENADEITLSEHTPVLKTYSNLQIGSFGKDSRTLIQKCDKRTGQWKTVYRFFGKSCNTDLTFESGELLLVSLLPKDI